MEQALENRAVRQAILLGFWLLILMAGAVKLYEQFLDVAPVYEHRWVKGPLDAIPADDGPVADSNGTRYREGEARTKFHAGDALIYERDICMLRHKPGKVVRTIVRLRDDREITYTPIVWNADHTVCSPPPVVKVVVIPSDFLPGKYELRFHVVIQVNSERTFEEDIPSIPFEVVQ